MASRPVDRGASSLKEGCAPSVARYAADMTVGDQAGEWPSSAPQGAGFRLSYRGVAVAGLITGLASLVTLVIVVYLKDIDALSTVALALAILAFVVQLMVYILQTSQTTEQARQAGDLHARSMAILSQIQERTQGTQASVDRMNARLVEAVIQKYGASGADMQSPETAREIAEVVSAASSADAMGLDTGFIERDGMQFPPPLSPGRKRALRRQIGTPLTDQEAMEALSLIQSLGPTGKRVLIHYVNDLSRSVAPGMALGPGLPGSGPGDVEAGKAGIIEKIPGWRLYSLTDKGVLVARAFITGPTNPEQHTALVQEISRLKDAYAMFQASIYDRREKDS